MSDFENLLPDEIYKQGKRSYIAGDYSKALEYLSKACKSIASLKDDTCDELFEPYFYYAKSLYMYSKFSSDDVIGDDVQEVAGKSNENSDMPINKEDTNNNESRVEGDLEDVAVEGVEEVEVGDVEDGADVEEEGNVETDGNIEDEGNEIEELEEDCTDAANKSDTDEDIGYLQMAYETIECAKLIISRQLSDSTSDKKDLELKLADCCDVAGDIYLEEEVLKEATDEYERALDLRIKNLSANDRLIAESYYKIAAAYNTDYRLAEAKENFEKCRVVLCGNKEVCVKDGRDTAELDAIIVEIEEKIADTDDAIREYERSKETLKLLLVGRSAGSQAVATAPPQSDLTHLVRKKKRSDEDGAPPVKVARKEDE